MPADDLEILDDIPACVGRGRTVDGCDVAAWVIPSMTWFGSPRYTPKLERRFVSWNTFWRGRRRRTFDEAKARALQVLARIDVHGERRDSPGWL